MFQEFLNLVPVFSNNYSIVKDVDFLKQNEPVSIDDIKTGSFCIYYNENDPIKYHLILGLDKVSDSSTGEMVFDMTDSRNHFVESGDRNCYKIYGDIYLVPPTIDVGELLGRNIPTGNFMIDPKTNDILMNLSSIYDPYVPRKVWNFTKNEMIKSSAITIKPMSAIFIINGSGGDESQQIKTAEPSVQF